jgi:hypothetical protein
MKPRIWIGVFLIFSLVAGCSQPKSATVSDAPAPSETPSETASETPAPVETTIAASPAPTPAAIEPQPSPNPVFAPSPAPQKTIVSVAPKLDKSVYPTPKPAKIVTEPTKVAKNKAVDKTEPASKLIPSERQITATSIGTAKVGMTLGELKKKLGAGFQYRVKNNFIDNFDALAVVKNGAVQYYLPYPASTKLTDADRIQHITTDNPSYRTEQGVGPGTPIGQASSVYGTPTFSFSRDDRTGEFVNFTQNPSGIAFRPKASRNRTFAGEYPESNEEYLKTDKYDPKAAIGQISISCGDDCGKGEGDNTSPAIDPNGNRSSAKPVGDTIGDTIGNAASESPERDIAPSSAPARIVTPSISSSAPPLVSPAPSPAVTAPTLPTTEPTSSP